MQKLDFSTFHKRMIEASSKYSSRIKHAYQISKKLGDNTLIALSNSKILLAKYGEYSIRDIFIKYWTVYEEFMNRHNISIRQSVYDNVYAMVKCGSFDSDNGYLYFECPNPECNNFHIQPFTCKSRFCPSCGKKYNDARSIEISKKCINVPHRHIVFTIPSILNCFIEIDRSLLDCLFEAVDLTFKLLAEKAGKKKKYKFGYILTVHTFGRDLKFNAHIRAIIAECMIDENGNIKKYNYFHYESMRKTFMYYLINLLKKKINMTRFTAFAKTIIEKYSNGFYVHGPQLQGKTKEDNKKLIRYVVRYAGHPPMSESRIININDDDKMIEYYYDPHEDDLIENDDDKIGRQFIHEPIDVFITKLIKHIPENGKHNYHLPSFLQIL